MEKMTGLSTSQMTRLIRVYLEHRERARKAVPAARVSRPVHGCRYSAAGGTGGTTAGQNFPPPANPRGGLARAMRSISGPVCLRTIRDLRDLQRLRPTMVINN